MIITSCNMIPHVILLNLSHGGTWCYDNVINKVTRVVGGLGRKAVTSHR